jgi:hypothetical protein
MTQKYMTPESTPLSVSFRRLLARDFPERQEIRNRLAFMEEVCSRTPQIDYYLLTGEWPSGPRLLVYPRLWWERLMRCTPSAASLRSLSEWLECTGTLANSALKIAIIGVGLYVLGEVVWAFLPGGAAWHVLEGSR